MPKTTTDLYRRGNSQGPRLSNVRTGKDVVTLFVNGVEWVTERSGGVSTFSKKGPGTNWWMLPAGSDFPDELIIVNDHGDHFNWEPEVDMPLASFVALLASAEQAFQRVA